MWQFRPSWPGQLSCSFHGKQERQQRADRWRVVGYSSTTTLGLGGDCQLSSSVQFQCGHSRRTGYVACSPGSVLWSERKHGQGETEFAPVHLLRYGKALRMFLLRSCGASFSMPTFFANAFTTCQTTFSVRPSPQTLAALLTRRNNLPLLIPAAANQ